MDYLNVPEGYEPSHLPYQPSQRQGAGEQRPASPKQPAAEQSVKPQAKMPKAQALAIARRMKQGIAVGSLLCFGTVAGLIVNQANSAQTQQVTAAASSQTSSQSSSKSGTTSSQGGSSTQAGTTAPQGGGYGFGSTSTAQPVSGSHTS